MSTFDESIEALLEQGQRDAAEKDRGTKTLPVIEKGRGFEKNRTSMSLTHDSPRSRRSRDHDRSSEERASAHGSVSSRRDDDRSRREGRRDRHGLSPGASGYYDRYDRRRSRSPAKHDEYRMPQRHRPGNNYRDEDYDDRRRRSDDRGGRYHDSRRSPREDRGRYSDRRRRESPKGRRDATPEPNDEDRDQRTIFVQQLSQRLRTHQFHDFFSKVGPVVECTIVKDRVTKRSKGVGYVEFKDVESVAKALDLTGQQLIGMPVIVSRTEAEKNRAARNTDAHPTVSNGLPFHRLYVGNIHFNITEKDLEDIFGQYGEVEFVQLQKDDNGRSRGYGFVQ
jgi:RNA-binding protein 23/39